MDEKVTRHELTGRFSADMPKQRGLLTWRHEPIFLICGQGRKRVATLAMSRIRKTSISLLAVLIAAGLIHELGLLPFETGQAVAAGFGMVVGVAILGLACWEFPKIRMDVINGVGYPSFLGPISIAALLGGLAGYWVFTIMVVGR